MAEEIKLKGETSTSIIIPTDSIQEKIVPVTVIRKLVKAIKEQLKELEEIEKIEINIKNYEKVDGILIATDSLINDCYSTNEFTCNKNDNFLKLIYLYQRISIRLEIYKLQEVINQVELKNNELKEKQIILEETYKKSEEQSNNLVYNILGFIASFSVVSAAVVAIENINSMSGIMIFMAFTAFILLTTLIGLHNFYKRNSGRKGKLQDNYFLWKMMIVVIILLIGYRGIEYFKENRNEILEDIGRGIGQAIKIDE